MSSQHTSIISIIKANCGHRQIRLAYRNEKYCSQVDCNSYSYWDWVTVIIIRNGRKLLLEEEYTCFCIRHSWFPERLKDILWVLQKWSFECLIGYSQVFNHTPYGSAWAWWVRITLGKNKILSSLLPVAPSWKSIECRANNSQDVLTSCKDSD